MRTTTQQIGNAIFANGATLSGALNLYDMTLAAIAVPAGSALNGKTATFVNVINGVEYDVVKDDGTAYSVTLTASKSVAINENIAKSLSEFKIKVNSAVAADAYAVLMGVNA